MRWKNKKYPLDEEREETWFAWLPVNLENGEVIWLEKVIAKVIYWRGGGTGNIYRQVLQTKKKAV